jgi:hypothetical protein
VLGKVADDLVTAGLAEAAEEEDLLQMDQELKEAVITDHNRNYHERLPAAEVLASRKHK